MFLGWLHKPQAQAPPTPWQKANRPGHLRKSEARFIVSTGDDAIFGQEWPRKWMNMMGNDGKWMGKWMENGWKMDGKKIMKMV